jgi:hypothetical protein
LYLDKTEILLKVTLNIATKILTPLLWVVSSFNCYHCLWFSGNRIGNIIIFCYVSFFLKKHIRGRGAIILNNTFEATTFCS